MTVHRHHQRPQLFATLKMSRIEIVQNKFVFGIPDSNIWIDWDYWSQAYFKKIVFKS
jgi:hypothetical protein